jgi:hypothetical protein
MRRTSKAFALSSMLGPLAFGSGAPAQDGSEVDLTGTWEGTQVCDDLIGGEFANFVDNEHRLLIVQDGDSFRLLYTAKPEGRLQTISSTRASFRMSKAASVRGVGRHLWWRLQSRGDRPAAADRSLGNRGPFRCRLHFLHR